MFDQTFPGWVRILMLEFPSIFFPSNCDIYSGYGALKLNFIEPVIKICQNNRFNVITYSLAPPRLAASEWEDKEHRHISTRLNQ